MSGKAAERLSRDRIVSEAIALLDSAGEPGLTFRALAARLETGHGAIQWHVATKDELVDAAATTIIRDALLFEGDGTSPEKIYRTAASVFRAVDQHFWVASRLARSPWPRSTMLLFERLGQQVQSLTDDFRMQFSATSALVHYIVGGSAQNAANTTSAEARSGRARVLESGAASWSALDENDFPFTRSVAAQLGAHDDEREFLAGVAIIVAGIGEQPLADRVRQTGAVQSRIR